MIFYFGVLLILHDSLKLKIRGQVEKQKATITN